MFMSGWRIDERERMGAIETGLLVMVIVLVSFLVFWRRSPDKLPDERQPTDEDILTAAMAKAAADRRAALHNLEEARSAWLDGLADTRREWQAVHTEKPAEPSPALLFSSPGARFAVDVDQQYLEDIVLVEADGTRRLLAKLYLSSLDSDDYNMTQRSLARALVTMANSSTEDSESEKG